MVLTPQLFDASTIDQFQWPDTIEGQKAKNYLYPLIKEGVTPYLDNAVTEMQLLAYKDVFLPLTFNEKEYDNSYVVSNYCVIKLYEESIKKYRPEQLFLHKPLIWFGGSLLKWFKVNKTIFLNNWLLSSTLLPTLSNEDLNVIVDYLAKQFPDHSIIFRNVDVLMKKELLSALKKNSFHLLKTRDVYFYNPLIPSTKTKNMRRRASADLKILQDLNLQIVRSNEIQECDYPRLRLLYEKLYVEKYTRYSPRFSEKFIKNTHQKGVVTYVALKREGIIVGFFSYFTHNQTMVNCLFGYDTELACAHDLYKILTRLALDEATALGLVINDGSGGDSAKSLRGMKPYAEYMGLYNRHLPLPRRTLWNAIAFFYNKIQKSTI